MSGPDTKDPSATREVPMPDPRQEILESVLYDARVAPTNDDLREAPEFTDIERYQEELHRADLGKRETVRGTQQVETQQGISPQDAETAHRMFLQSGTLLPPYDPGQLQHLLEHSNSLRQNIDAYATNIDGFGHHFEPTINLESDDLVEQVRVAMFQDRALAGDNSAQFPSDEEVEAKIEEIRHDMAIEKIKLEFFFKNAADKAFVTHRMETRQDKETTGNAYWEVLRDQEGNIAQFNLVPSHTVRLVPQGQELVETTRHVQVTPITFTRRVFRRRFRTYVQVFGDVQVYFKEFGDPRAISNKTGTAYATVEDLMEAEGEMGSAPANELIHFAVYSSRSPYGVPRWIGTLLAVLGSRQAEEVNFMYFDNKSVPPMALLVSGGRVSKETVKRVEDYVEAEIKGRKNYHKILLLEAEGVSGEGPEHTGRMKIELKPLTQAIHNDGLFQSYDKENVNKVGQSFRLSPLLRGDSRDINRATSQAALKFTEQQVFAPERNKFDDTMNRLVLSDMEICYHRYKSNSPKTTDPEDAARVVERLAKIGALVPRDVRTLAEEILNVELKRIEEPWMDIPLPLATSGRIAELIEGTGDLFDNGAPLNVEDPEPAEPAEPEPSPAERVLRTLTGSSLASGGKLSPAQNTRARRVPPSPFADGKDLGAEAEKMMHARNILKAAELAAREADIAQDEFSAAQDDLETETIRVPKDVWESFALLPEDD